MNRLDLLKEVKDCLYNNLFCYSSDYLMNKAKSGYENRWEETQEKLELIEELIEEEKKQKFHLYTSLYNLNNDKENRINHDLAYLEERENGVSCFMTLREKIDGQNPEYELIFNIHKKDAFDDEYENVYCKDIDKEAFKDRETLKNTMQEGLESFKKFIEIDKNKNRIFNKFYEQEEIQELE